MYRVFYSLAITLQILVTFPLIMGNSLIIYLRVNTNFLYISTDFHSITAQFQCVYLGEIMYTLEESPNNDPRVIQRTPPPQSSSSAQGWSVPVTTAPENFPALQTALSTVCFGLTRPLLGNLCFLQGAPPLS